MVKMKGQLVSYVREYQYLGIILDKKLNIANHLKYVADKGTKIIYMIRCGAQANWGLGFETLRTLYTEVGEAVTLPTSRCLPVTKMFGPIK